MKKTQFEIMEDNLRTSVFKRTDLKGTEKVFATLYLKKTLGDKVATGDARLKVPNTWNIKLYSNYVLLQDMLTNMNIEDMKEKVPAVLRQVFLVKSLISKNDEKNFLNVREATINYFKNAIFSKDKRSKFIYKSNKMSVRVSFKKRTVSMKDYKKNEIFYKDIDIEDLDLFPTIKTII